MSKRLTYNILLYIMAFLCMLSIVVSCVDDDIVDNNNDGRITFQIIDKQNVLADSDAKKAGIEQATQQQCTLHVDNNKLILDFWSEENNKLYSESPVTRGATYDNTTHTISQIYVTAVCSEGDGGKNYFENEKITINNSQGSSQYFWPIGETSFYAYCYSKENVTVSPVFTRENNESKGTFDYTLPTASTGDTKNDAVNQPDVVFAIAPDMSRQTSHNVGLVFHHALSAITFKVGKMPDNVFLKSITLSGVYKSGNCSMMATEGNNIAFTWTYTGKQQDGVYAQDIKANAVEGNMMGNEEATFMMLPQNMGNNTKFLLTFSINGREYTLEKSFNTFITSWEADKKYIFTIGLPNEIDVEIDDMVDGIVKKDVTVQNTGIATGYIRVAIIGYWKNSAGQACDTWLESDGTFTYGNQWNNYWKKGSDGFYYYLLPVKHNEYTYPLFDKYTLSTNIAQDHVNQNLEIDLATQIIPIEYKSLWPELGSL